VSSCWLSRPFIVVASIERRIEMGSTVRAASVVVGWMMMFDDDDADDAALLSGGAGW
jgi:hypothetical protein